MINSIANTPVYQAISLEIIQPLVYLLFGVAVVYFIYGAVRYIQSLGKGDLEGKESGKRHLIFGILGLAIMLSVFGIMNFLYDIVTGGNAQDLSGNGIERPAEIDHF
jgi:hypothetical protein